ncbi:UNVERIFIED_CONTAM: hypothetical protein Sangu_0488900 [Sesamum angustifolium]|uniref:RNase H type-1 domain-containing protein n=1 Tax=Sesamum angustifolium TaxID=2727405 RepID=A0AAW2Q846_9LAMI
MISHIYLGRPLRPRADFVSEMIGKPRQKFPKKDLGYYTWMDPPPHKGVKAGVVITSPQGEDMEFAIKFDFNTSKNEAEYEALVLGMRLAQDVGASHLLTYCDSQLIVKIGERGAEAKEDSMTQYLQQIEELKTKF